MPSSAPARHREGVSGQVRRKRQVIEQYAQLQQESHVRRRMHILTREAARLCTVMLLDATISAASNTCVLRSQQRALKGQMELVKSQASLKGGGTASALLT